MAWLPVPGTVQQVIGNQAIKRHDHNARFCSPPVIGRAWRRKSSRSEPIILDLEDAVPIADKAAMRGAIKTALLSYPRVRSCKTYVGVNSLHAGLTANDVCGILCPALDGIILPKVESAGGLREEDTVVGHIAEALGFPRGRRDIIPSIERRGTC
jgi:citrate lyase subunit beta/citryl-CoA lyase